MSEKNDGGPAFPCAETQYSNSVPGMTLRDWFAGQAMIGFMSSGALIEGQRTIKGDLIANMSYSYADDMLAERVKS